MKEDLVCECESTDITTYFNSPFPAPGTTERVILMQKCNLCSVVAECRTGPTDTERIEELEEQVKKLQELVDKLDGEMMMKRPISPMMFKDGQL